MARSNVLLMKVQRGVNTTEELYRQYREELVNWCTAMAQSRSLAEDLVQEAFLRALMNQELIEGLLPEQQRAWLYRTVRNLYTDRLRRAALETTRFALADEPPFWEDYDEADVRQMLHILPENERILFVMRYWQGYSSSELGEIFGLPAGTVRYQLSSARKRLKSEFEKGD